MSTGEEERHMKSNCPLDPEVASRADETSPLLGYGAVKGYDARMIIDENSETREKLVSSVPDGFMYHPHFTVWGFLAVAILALDHGNPMFARYNLFFMQNWALQIVFVLGGIYFGMMREGVGNAFLCLCGYFVVGTLLNVVAYAVTDPAAANNNMWNVVFQFWLVLGLIGYSALLLPVKSYLHKARDARSAGSERDGLAHERGGACAIGVVVVGAGLAFIWVAMSLVMANVVDGVLAFHIELILQSMGDGMAFWVGDTKTALTSMCASAELSLSNIWLAISVPLLFPSQQGLTVWLMVLNLHLRRLAIWYSGIGQKFWHGFDLMLIGLVAYYMGMKWRMAVGQKLTRYWFVWVALCGAVWQPGTQDRLDLWNSEPLYLRWRMMVIDLTLLVVWLSASERLIDGRVLTKDQCRRVSLLTLGLFLVHQSVFVLFPVPFNWVVILSMVSISLVSIMMHKDGVEDSSA